MTMLGTIRKNKPELPEEIPNKEVPSSLFYFIEDTAVVSYITKKEQECYEHFALWQRSWQQICQKQLMIFDYNSTKEAVDTLYQLLKLHLQKTNH
ncbi:hypothetical protein TNCT_18651 [Trichonephila clavata]|uniref:Uncharacterized protein n=1 Tax=Trichonephila clavata TaxID=2740835 RepID=A0A8X6IK18_TRICU|nr:hypothetical protein TNCT_18651 [Trichonephila clavata]